MFGYSGTLFRWFLFCFHWLSNCCFYWSILRKERRFQTTRNWWRRSDRGPVTFTTPSGCLLLLVSFLFFSFFVNSSCYLIRWRSGGFFVFRRPPSMSGRCRRRSKIVAQHDVDETVFHQGHEDESAKKKQKKTNEAEFTTQLESGTESTCLISSCLIKKTKTKNKTKWRSVPSIDPKGERKATRCWLETRKLGLKSTPGGVCSPSSIMNGAQARKNEKKTVANEGWRSILNRKTNKKFAEPSDCRIGFPESFGLNSTFFGAVNPSSAESNYLLSPTLSVEVAECRGNLGG